MSNGKTNVLIYAHDLCFAKSFSSSRIVLLQVFYPIFQSSTKMVCLLCRTLVVIVNQFVFWSQVLKKR